MNAQDFRGLQEAYMEVVENQQLDEVSDRKVRAVRDAREKQWNNQFGKNRVQDPTDDMVDKVDKLIDQRNKRTGSKVKKTTMGQLRDKLRREVVENQQLDEVLDTPEKAQEYAKKNVKSMVGAFVKGAVNKDISQLKTIQKRKRGAELAKRKAERKAAEEMKEGRVPWNDPKNPLESGHTPAEKNRAKRERTGVEDLSKSPTDKDYARYGDMKSVDDEQSSVKRKDKPHKFRDLPIRTDKGKKQTLGQMRRTRGIPKPGASDEKSNLYQSPIRKDDKRTRGGKSDQWQGPNPRNEQVDVYDLILSHLLDEGYAETVEAAEVMMVNMSEEWIDTVVEEILDEENERRQTRRAARNMIDRYRTMTKGVDQGDRTGPEGYLRNRAKTGG